MVTIFSGWIHDRNPTYAAISGFGDSFHNPLGVFSIVYSLVILLNYLRKSSKNIAERIKGAKWKGSDFFLIITIPMSDLWRLDDCYYRKIWKDFKVLIVKVGDLVGAKHNQGNWQMQFRYMFNWVYEMTIIHLYLFGNLYLAKSSIQKRVKFEKHAHLIIILHFVTISLLQCTLFSSAEPYISVGHLIQFLLLLIYRELFHFDKHLLNIS